MTTPNLGLEKPAYLESGATWWSKINGNFDKLDNAVLPLTVIAPSGGDDTAAILAAYAALPTDGTLGFLADDYTISDTGATGIALNFDAQKNIRFNGATFNYSGDNTAMQFGHAAGGVTYNAVVEGPLYIIKPAPVDVAHMTGNGMRFQNTKWFTFKGPSYVLGFEAGYLFYGSGAGCTESEFYGLQSQSCKIDHKFATANSANSFVTALRIYDSKATYDATTYGTRTAGTRFIEINKAEALAVTIDGIVYRGGIFQEAKERKLYCAANSAFLDNVYWDISNGGTDIELTADSSRIVLWAGNGLELQTITNAGANNTIWAPQVMGFGMVAECDGAPAIPRGSLSFPGASAASATGTITLTENTTTTDLPSYEIMANSLIFLFPTTANAAAVVAGTYVSAILPPGTGGGESGVAYGIATITHPNDANVDKTMNYWIVNK